MDCLSDDMATAAELTRIIDRLEERVTNHITFFRWGIGFMFLWLAAGTGLFIDMRSDVKILMLPQKLSQAAANPADPKNQAQAIAIVDTAREKSFVIPPLVLASAAKSFIDGTDSQKGWETGLHLASYRSSLNVPEAERDYGPWTGPVHFEGFSVPEKPFPKITVTAQGAPVSNMALLEHLGQPSNPPGTTSGPAAMLVEGGAIDIDTLHVRHAKIQRVEVHYEGKELLLEDVVFVDCIFAFSLNEHTKALAKAVLIDGATTWPIPLQPSTRF